MIRGNGGKTNIDFTPIIIKSNIDLNAPQDCFRDDRAIAPRNIFILYSAPANESRRRTWKLATICTEN
jgi:hypothetical protein